MSESMTVEQRLQQIAAEKGYHPASEYMQALRLGAKEAICENVPEGCTPADARVLREANHALAAEVARLRLDVQNVVDANEEYHDDALALEKERDELADEVERLRNDVMRTEQENALLIAALKKEQDSVDGLNGRIVRLESRVAELEAEKWNAQIAEGALASVEKERDDLRRRVAELEPKHECACGMCKMHKDVARIKAEAVREAIAAVDTLDISGMLPSHKVGFCACIDELEKYANQIEGGE